MKSLRLRPWLLGMIAVLLSLTYLIFWVQPPSGWELRNSPSMPTLIRALQKKDSRLNQFEVAVWGRLPMFVHTYCSSLGPRLARETRLDACSRLASLGARATNAVPCLIKALDDPDINVRSVAIAALGAIGPPASGAKGPLLAILRDPAYRSRYRVRSSPDDPAIALASIAPRDPEVVSALLELIAHPGTNGLPPYFIALEWIRRAPEALPLFESIRKTLPQKQSWTLVQGVAQSYPDAKKRLAVLLGLAEDADYGIRCHAVQGLEALGPPAAEAVPKLIEMFRATEREWEDLPEDRQRDRFEAYAAFVDATAPPAFFARRYAPSTVRGPASPAAPAVPPTPPPAPGPAVRAGTPAYAVRYAVRPPPPMGRLPGFGGLHHQVILALGEIGPPAQDAIPLLVQESQDPTDPLRFEAAVARVRIDGKFAEIVPVLAAGLERAGPELQVQLLSRIAQLARTRDGAVRLLIEALANPDPELRLQAFKSLADLGGKAAPALPAFIAALDDPDVEIRFQAVKNLRALGSHAARALPALIKALGDPDKPVRLQAVVSLAALGDRAAPALPALRQMAWERYIDVRITASNAVRTIESATTSSPGAHSSGP